MADIFISYARADRDRIEKLASALEGEGYSVWWDRDLTGGEEFSKEIERELHAAKAVIVAWSKNGAASHWVRDEASLARSESKLFPIRLDAENLPLGFQQFHTFDFSGWPEKDGAASVASLVASIDKRTGAPHEPAQPPTQATAWTPGAPTKIKPLYLGIGGAGVLILAAVLFLIGGPSDAPEPSDDGAAGDQEVIAAADGMVGLGVIPFVNMSSDEEQEYFADGLTEELLNWLANVEGLRVPGRTASFRFKTQAGDFAEIGEALDVEYLLEGSVRRAGDSLRITAQLIEAETGFHLWSETYDRQMDDIFAIQDDVAQTVVTELLGRIPKTGADNPAAVGDVDPEAHKLYLEGRALFSIRRPAEAYEKFRAAVEVDPDHWLAQAYVSIAGALAAIHGTVENSQENPINAIINDALSKAVAASPESADVLFARGWVRSYNSGEIGQEDPEVSSLYRQAIRANPRHSEALHALANRTYDTDARIELYKRVIEIEPGHHSANANLAHHYKVSGNPEQALATMRAYLAVSPDDSPSLVSELLKDFGEWEEHFEISLQLISRDERDSFDLYHAGMTLADFGETEEAARLLHYAANQIEGSAVAQWMKSRAAIMQGDYAQAVQALEVLKDAPEQPDWFSFNYARALLHSGQPQRSLDVILVDYPGLLGGDEPEIRFDFFGSYVDMEVHAGALAMRQLGRDEEAERLWRALLPLLEPPAIEGWQLSLGRAMVFAQTNEPERAFEELERAYDEGFRFLYSYNCDMCTEPGFYARTGVFGPLMDDPRFEAYVAKIERDNAEYYERVSEKIGLPEMLAALYADEQQAQE